MPSHPRSLLLSSEQQMLLTHLHLIKGAESGDVMACYDVGFLMIQGIGCDVDWKGGIEFVSKGSKLEEESPDMSWKLCGSATELIEPQSMFVGGLLF